jgi:hypothetical protein
MYCICTPQGELEHRRAKAWYKRTNRKNFIKQMTQIECRQARLKEIEAKISAGSQPSITVDDETISGPPEAHHIIGKTQNIHEGIGHFYQRNRGDPAFKVCAYYHYPQLRQYLIKAKTGLHSRAQTAPSTPNPSHAWHFRKSRLG